MIPNSPPEIPPSPGQISFFEVLALIARSLPNGFQNADIMSPVFVEVEGINFIIIYIKQGNLQQPIALTEDDFNLPVKDLEGLIQQQTHKAFQKISQEKKSQIINAMNERLSSTNN